MDKLGTNLLGWHKSNPKAIDRFNKRLPAAKTFKPNLLPIKHQQRPNLLNIILRVSMFSKHH